MNNVLKCYDNVYITAGSIIDTSAEPRSKVDLFELQSHSTEISRSSVLSEYHSIF